MIVERISSSEGVTFGKEFRSVKLDVVAVAEQEGGPWSPKLRIIFENSYLYANLGGDIRCVQMTRLLTLIHVLGGHLQCSEEVALLYQTLSQNYAAVRKQLLRFGHDSLALERARRMAFGTGISEKLVRYWARDLPSRGVVVDEADLASAHMGMQSLEDVYVEVWRLDRVRTGCVALPDVSSGGNVRVPKKFLSQPLGSAWVHAYAS